MLSLLVVVIIIFFVDVSIKTLFFTVPAFILSLCPYSGHTAPLQVILAALWLIIIASNGKVAAHAYQSRESNMLLALLAVLGAGAAIPLLKLLSRYPIGMNAETLIGFFGFAILSTGAAWYMIRYAIWPLFVREKVVINTSLEDYYITSIGRRRFVYCIRFHQDPAEYRIGYFAFKKFRGKVGVSYSVVKYTCIMDVCFLSKIKQLDDKTGTLSQWDSAFTKHEHRLVKESLVVPIVVVISLMVIVAAFALMSGS